MKKLLGAILLLVVVCGCTGEDTPPEANCINSADILRETGTVDYKNAAPGTSFIHTWRVVNAGSCTWDETYSLVEIAGTVISVQPTTPRLAHTPPGGELLITVKLWVDEAAPNNVTQSAAFELKSPQGKSFGDPLTIQVRVSKNTSTQTPTPHPAVTVQAPIGANCVNDGAFLGDVTIPDGTVVIPGQPFNKIWRYQNTGTCAWSKNTYRLVQVTGSAISMAQQVVHLPDAQPGQIVDIPVTLILISGTPTGKTESAYFELRAPNNSAFGLAPYVEVVAGVLDATTLPDAGGVCTNNAVFIQDITIPDQTIVPRGQPFVKTWQLQNTGTCPWNSNYTLNKILGNEITAQTLALPAVNPGETVNLSITLTLSPQATVGAVYTATFDIYTPTGQAFGVQPYVQVIAGQ